MEGGGVAALASSKSVLVVDDDDAIRLTVADALEDEGYQVLTASNGQEALEQVESRPPDAIVLDLMMPILDGWGFLEACRSRQLCQDIPILVMSAYRRLAETAPDLKVRACIAKPFELDVLLGAVERLLQHAA
jgi:two-component system, chemotaxis family, chemotaxis protein CheY